MIFSGPHIMTANPFAKCPRRICELSSDYDVIDLTFIPATYYPRTNYDIACSYDEYLSFVESWLNRWKSGVFFCTQPSGKL